MVFALLLFSHKHLFQGSFGRILIKLYWFLEDFLLKAEDISLLNHYSSAQPGNLLAQTSVLISLPKILKKMLHELTLPSLVLASHFIHCVIDSPKWLVCVFLNEQTNHQSSFLCIHLFDLIRILLCFAPDKTSSEKMQGNDKAAFLLLFRINDTLLLFGWELINSFLLPPLE